MPQYPSVPFGGAYPELPQAPTMHGAQIVGKAMQEGGKVVSNLSTLYEDMKAKRVKALEEKERYDRSQTEKERAGKERDKYMSDMVKQRSEYYKTLTDEKKEAKKEKERLAKLNKMPKSTSEAIYSEIEKNLRTPGEGYGVEEALKKSKSRRAEIDSKRKLLQKSITYTEKMTEKYGAESDFLADIMETTDPVADASELKTLDKEYNELHQLESTLKAQGTSTSGGTSTQQKIPIDVLTEVPQELIDLANDQTVSQASRDEAQAMIDDIRKRQQ